MAYVTTDRRTGNYLVRAYAGIRPDTGRPFSVSETLPAAATEAEIDEARRRVDARAAVTKGDAALMTVGTLLDWHLGNMEDDGASPTTMSAYRSYQRRHVAPRIGSVPVESADAALFSRFYRELRRDREAGGAGLAVATVEKIHAMLSGCFVKAVSDGLLKGSPLAGVKVPRGKSPEARPLLPADLGRLVEWLDAELARPILDEDDFEAWALATIIATAHGTGLRRGELSALRRMSLRFDPDDEDHDAPRVLRVSENVVWKRGVGWVYKDPKSATSKRNVSLGASIADVLAQWDVTSADLIDRATGALPDDMSPLFCHFDGSMWTPTEIAEGFKEVCRKAGLPPWVHLHTLRHTHATYLLEHGENVRTVQERLGHSDVRTTLGTYGHVMPGRDAEAARAYEEAARIVAQRSRSGHGPRYAPKCPLSGKTCARFERRKLEM